jgi:PAS domain S-box-containing protein
MELLQKQLVAQKKINQLLIDRLERSVGIESNAFSIFEQNSLLQQRVQERTGELESANRLLRLEITERKLAEQALRFSEERYRSLMEETEQPFLVVRGFDFAYINPAFCRLLGYDDAEELMRAGLRAIILPEEEHLYRERQRRRSTGESVESRYEARFVRRGGEQFWVEVSAQFGEFEGSPAILASIHDITERKLAEQELATSFSLLQATLESTADGVLVVDLSNRIVTYNRKFVEMWGIPQHLLDSRDDNAAVGHILDQIEDPEGFVEKIQSLYKEPETLSSDLIRFLDGRVFERFSQPQRIEGKCVGRVWSFRDITERKRAEESLVRLYTAIEHAGESVVVTDSSNHIVYVNPAFEKVTGFKRDYAMGRHGRFIVHDSVNPSLYSDINMRLERGQAWSGRITNRRPDGSPCEVETTISAVRDSEGRITNYVSVYRDVTRELSLQAQLQQAQKMEAIGTLAGGIAHDFNNILYAILGYAELVLDRLPKGSSAWSDQQEVLTAARRAAELVKHILAFSRQSKSEQHPVCVAGVVSEVLRLMRASLPTTIALHSTIDAPDAMVLADATQLHQVLMNLCTNAGHAMAETGGTLEVTLRSLEIESEDESESLRDFRKPGHYVVLSVKDTGQGISAEHLDRIFDPFFTTKEVGVGTGLGLSTVHGIVTNAGGDITVQSQLGQGTVFNVYLPLTAGEAAAVVIETRRSAGGSEHILFVDDEIPLTRMAREILERQGYKVTAVSSPVDALALFEESPGGYDLVITDQTMPTLTGSALAERMLALRPELPIILCTGFSQIMSRERALSLGFIEYLNKPVAMRTLSDAVRRALDDSRGMEIEVESAA